CGQTVLHLPQPRLPDVPAGHAPAAAAGVCALRLVLPRPAPRPGGLARVDAAARSRPARTLRHPPVGRQDAARPGPGRLGPPRPRPTASSAPGRSAPAARRGTAPPPPAPRRGTV